MVGMIAVTVIPLALIAPGLSNQFADKAAEEERLEPVYDEDVAPADAQPASNYVQADYSQQSLPIYGETPSFGEPMMDPSAPTAESVASAGPDNASAPGPSPSPTVNRNSAPPSPSPAQTSSQSDIERMAAERLGLRTTPSVSNGAAPAPKTTKRPNDPLITYKAR